MKKSFPGWIEPMKASLTKDYFWDRGWTYEEKLDGERILARKRDGQITLYSRNKIIQNNNYPELVQALAESRGNWWIDGEVVALKDRTSSFKLLQKRMHTSRENDIPIVYCVFDIMALDDDDLRDVPFKLRRQILHDSIKTNKYIQFVKTIDKPEKYFQSAKKMGLEGMIVKDPISAYQPSRSRDWLKFKTSKEQEFIIIGYTSPHGLRQYFGAILLGYYENGELVYAGKVGTGFNLESLADLHGMFENYETKTSPLQFDIDEKSVHFLEPKLVCQVAFTEWTDEAKLRHPRYLGLRHDKIAKEVIRES